MFACALCAARASTPFVLCTSVRPCCLVGTLFSGFPNLPAAVLRLDIGFILNVADDILNFFEFEAPQLLPPPPKRGAVAAGAAQASEAGGNGGGVPPSTSYSSSGQQLTPARRPLVYCKLGVADYGLDAGIRRVFGEAVRFAALARAGASGGGGNLLVHCRFGMNRSPTVATAVLMELEGLSLREAWRGLKACCPYAYPQLDNRRELVRFEASTRGLLWGVV